jgi:uncharacterized protein (TIGR02145 family)
MAQNLRVTQYRNGEAIPTDFDDEEWSELSTGAFSLPENGVAGITTGAPSMEDIRTYGLLYNWYAATDSRGLCPEGWHVPSDEEWMELELLLGIDSNEIAATGPRGTNQGGMLKETGTIYWSSPNTGATNETGFSALATGGRSSSPDFRGEYWYRGERSTWWTATEYHTTFSFTRGVRYMDSAIHRDGVRRQSGMSIRCIMD